MQPEINTVYFGHVLDILKTWDDGCVHCVVTSPPYWGLRDYGTDPQKWSDGWVGELGLEPSPELFIQHIVEIFREVRRVLRDDGTLWFNMGDTYYSSGGRNKVGGPGSEDGFVGRAERPACGYRTGSPVLKPKDLCMMPARCAIALQEDGWYLRQDIIWHKPNPMPESVDDRCTKSHEYIFLLAKSQKYFYDADAIKESASYNTHERLARIKDDHKSLPDDMKNGMRPRKLAAQNSGIKNNDSFDAAMAVMPDYRNKRSVWSVCTEAYPEAHYATFPQELIKPCILAGCPEFIGITLDPFMGSGTTALVCRNLNRNYVGIELNPKNGVLIEKRLSQQRLNI